MDELKYELIAEVYGRMEAELIKSYFEAHEIDTELFQESIGQNIYPTTVDMFGNVQIFDEQGRLLMNWGETGPAPGQFWLPNAIAINSHNEIFVADAYNHRMQEFRYTGRE